MARTAAGILSKPHLRARDDLAIFANMRGASPEEIAERIFTQPTIAGLQGPTISRVVTRDQDRNWYAVNIIVPPRRLFQAVTEAARNRRQRRGGHAGQLHLRRRTAALHGHAQALEQTVERILKFIVLQIRAAMPHKFTAKKYFTDRYPEAQKHIMLRIRHRTRQKTILKRVPLGRHASAAGAAGEHPAPVRRSAQPGPGRGAHPGDVRRAATPPCAIGPLAWTGQPRPASASRPENWHAALDAMPPAPARSASSWRPSACGASTRPSRSPRG